MQLSALFKDARYFQILFQAVFLSYGLFFLHWDNEAWLYTNYFITSLVTQFICEYLFGKKETEIWQRYKKGIPSALISSFSLSLLLKTNYLWVAVIASFVSILSKYIVRINGKHVFNPSALGIVVAIVLTGNAWFSPGQWGSGAVMLFGVCCYHQGPKAGCKYRFPGNISRTFICKADHIPGLANGLFHSICKYREFIIVFLFYDYRSQNNSRS